MVFLVRSPIDDRDLCALPVDICSPRGVVPGRRVQAQGVIDTSATLTRIRADLVARLALPLTGMAQFDDPAHAQPAECATVLAEIVLRSRDRRVYSFEAEVLVAPWPMAVAIVLGMDCLRDGVFTAHLPDRWWSFRAPPDREA